MNADSPLAISRTPRLLLTAVLALSIAGCASHPPEGRDPAAEAKSDSDTRNAAAADPIDGESCRAYLARRGGTPTHGGASSLCGLGSAPPNRNRVAARDTAIARARAEIARSIRVTIKELIREEQSEDGVSNLDAVVQQVSRASLRGTRTERVWHSENGWVHALVSLDVSRVQGTVRSDTSLPERTRDAVADRAAEAFSELDTALQERAQSTR